MIVLVVAVEGLTADSSTGVPTVSTVDATDPESDTSTTSAVTTTVSATTIVATVSDDDQPAISPASTRVDASPSTNVLTAPPGATDPGVVPVTSERDG